MFTSAKPTTVIDSVSAVEGSFKIPTGGLAEVDILMMYSNKSTGTTFGTCPVRTFRLSEKTKQAFQAFVDSAEVDFGNLLLEGGFIAEAEGRISSMGIAETGDGLSPRGIGGS